MVTKYIIFSFKNANEAVDFVSYIQDRLRGKNVKIMVKGKRVKITLQANKQDLPPLIAMIKREYKNWRLSMYGITGVYKHSIARLLHDAKLKTSIPINSIIDVLKLKGYTARIKGGYIETTADFKGVIQIAEKISENYRKIIEKAQYAPMARRLLAIMLSISPHDNIEKLTEKLINAGILSIDRKSSKVTLALAYEKALEKIKEMVKENGDTFN